MAKSRSIHSNTFISVVIPATDMRVARAVESILNDRPNSFEIIVAFNNCDPQNQGALKAIFLQEVADGTLKVLYSPKSTIGGARNAAIAASCGTYIIHMDSDCKIKSGYFNKLDVFLKQRFLVARGNVHFLGSSSFLDRANCALKDSVYRNRSTICYTPNLIISAELQKKFLFDTATLHGEDTELSIRLSQNGIVPVILSEMVMDHIDYANSTAILKKYYLYGIARNHRFKNLRNNASTFVYYKKLFDEIPPLNDFPFQIRCGIFFLYVIRDLGVLYGLLRDSMI